MRYTEVLHGQEARDALKRGVDAVALPVAKTMGAKGRNGVYREYGVPKVTNDGVSIARRISPKDPFERLGADMVKEAAEKTNKDAGDGTTTATVLASAIVNEGFSFLQTGSDPMQLKRDIEADLVNAVGLIKDAAKKVETKEQLLDIARVSVEDEQMANIVVDAVEKAGEYGAVIVEEGHTYNIETETASGYYWDRGYVSPYMVTNEKGEAVLENPAVLVTDRYMNLNKDLMNVLGGLLQGGTTSALIVADKVDGELLASLIANKMKGIFTAVVVQRPETDEELRDIAILCNGTAVTKDLGIKQIQVPHFGSASRVVVTRDRCTILNAVTPALTEHIEKLTQDIKSATDDSDSESLKARRAKLSDGIVVIRVGARTEAERVYKKLKMDDAVGACQAAKQEGFVEGAGMTLYKISSSMKTTVMQNALKAPYQTILGNAGIPATGLAYNVKTHTIVENLIAEGIIDPAKVERCAVENAVSLACQLITIESVIVEQEEKSEK